MCSEPWFEVSGDSARKRRRVIDIPDVASLTRILVQLQSESIVLLVCNGCPRGSPSNLERVKRKLISNAIGYVFLKLKFTEISTPGISRARSCNLEIRGLTHGSDAPRNSRGTEKE